MFRDEVFLSVCARVFGTYKVDFHS